MRRLRIGIIGDLSVALPPKAYGGIERVLCLVAEGLQILGHEVTVFGPEQSSLPCRVIPFGPVLGEQHHKSWRHVARLWGLLNSHRADFDVIHNFFGAKYLLPLLPRRILKIISYACPVNPRVIRMTDRLGGPSMHYAACAAHMLERLDPTIDRSKWHVVYNPINLSSYSFHEQPDRDAPYLVFLSRLCAVKGAHTAIAAARKGGMRLVIAGNVQPSDQEYFDKQIKPHIDGERVQYVGPVNDAQKNDLLGNAAAMLFPIEWDEPFGLVVPETMACGTPVVAFRRGAMPELITHGSTGFLCENIDGMAAALQDLSALDRRACRESVVARFAPEAIARDYERLYYSLLGRADTSDERPPLTKAANT